MAKKKAAGRGGVRPGAGRPMHHDGPAVMIPASVPKSVADDLAAYAEAQGVSRSAVVQEALRAFFKRKKR